MLGEVGKSLLAAAQATSDVQDVLNQLARRYGCPELRIFVLPTVVFVEDLKAPIPVTQMFPVGSEVLRLDQSDEIDNLVRQALQESTEPHEVLSALERIHRLPSRFGAAMTLVGHTILTLGFGLVLNPTVSAMPIYLVLGLLVGGIVVFGQKFATLSLILPVFTAFAVVLVVELAVKPFVHDDVLRLVTPALVSFLPGMTLTVAAVELTTGQVMAGASRLMFGIARLCLLAFGVYAGLTVAGASAAAQHAPAQLGSWAPWVGIVFVAVGYYLFSAAPRGSLLWLFFALTVAYSAQLLGNILLGAVLSGLVGAIVVIPVVKLAGRLKNAPSRAVMLTCAYWMLVPGAMGFMGLSEAAAGKANAADTILQTLGSLIAISIGMVLGAGLSRDVSRAARGWRSAPTASTQLP